jgi:amidase
VLEVNPDAREIAEALDRERASRGARGSLHGIPILLEGNIATADRLHTSGSGRPPRASPRATRASSRGFAAPGGQSLGKAT